MRYWLPMLQHLYQAVLFALRMLLLLNGISQQSHKNESGQIADHIAAQDCCGRMMANRDANYCKHADHIFCAQRSVVQN